MKQTWLKIINIFLVLSAIGLVLWLFNKNFSAYDTLIIEASLGEDKAEISRLGPDPRVKLENDYQIIYETPIYFDLRTLPWFEQAQVYLIYQEVGQELVGLGGRSGPAWQYEVLSPVVVTDLADNWHKAVFSFDLDKVYQQKNISRFLISTKSLDQENKGELRIRQLKVILSR